MGYKEIMSQVDKSQAEKFMLNLKMRWNGHSHTFDQAVNDALSHIGISTYVGGGTANAVVSRMEKKSRISF